MKQKFTFNLLSKLGFYFRYFFYKAIIPLEVKSPKFKMWWYEALYSLMKFKNYEICLTWPFNDDLIKTRFGKFRIRANTSDAANVSPAFERPDQNYLINLIKTLSGHDQRVLFLDIGGDLGSYTVLVGNRFKSYNVDIKCFEPIEDSCVLIRENIQLNMLEGKAELYPFALLNKNQEEVEIKLNIGSPGSSSLTETTQQKTKTLVVQTRKLDDVLSDDDLEYDAVVMKIDVEGVEKEVLQGASKFVQKAKSVHVMVEDFINPDIIQFLQNEGWEFSAKVTTYNSWWFHKGH